jgi:CDP-diacylglycerol--serine O-phosphatidyltransferase
VDADDAAARSSDDAAATPASEPGEVARPGAQSDGFRSFTDGLEHTASSIESLIDDHEEEVSENGRTVKRRGVYLLPNLFTTGALFCGFYAVVAAMRGDFESAPIAILFALVFDGLDGRVARLTNTSSKFGWSAAFVFVACAALRLARFNVQSGSTDKRFFIGLPSPSGAGLVATMVWFGASRGVTDGTEVAWIAAVLTAGAGLLMVSNVRYHSFKEYHIGRVPMRVLLGVIIAFAIVLLDPPLVLLSVALIYIGSGPVLDLLRRRRSSS